MTCKNNLLTVLLVLRFSFSEAFSLSPRGAAIRTNIDSRPRTFVNNHVPFNPLQLSRKNEAVAEEKEAEEGVLAQFQLSFEQFPSTVALQDALTPVVQVIDDASSGWALSYADLSPETEATPVGQAFLATNTAYAIVGLLLTFNGDPLLGILTEIASIASFIYHYTQLQASNNHMKDGSVRLALLIDYICACTAILVGVAYLVMDHQLPPIESLLSGGAGIGCLLLCWVWEYGLPYIVLHSLWHLFSAYT